MPLLVCYIRSEVSPHNTMPVLGKAIIEFLFDDFSDVILLVALHEGMSSYINSILLHLFVHIGPLDDCFPLIRHLI